MADGSVASGVVESKYRGVSWYPNTMEWKAWIVAKDGKTTMTVGYFHMEEQAARAHDFAAEYMKTGAVLNFPNEKTPASLVRMIRPKLVAFRRQCIELIKKRDMEELKKHG